MKLKFNHDCCFSENGFDVIYATKGEERNVADTAACALLNEGRAISMEPRKTMDEITAELIADIRAAREAKRNAA